MDTKNQLLGINKHFLDAKQMGTKKQFRDTPKSFFGYQKSILGTQNQFWDTTNRFLGPLRSTKIHKIQK